MKIECLRPIHLCFSIFCILVSPGLGADENRSFTTPETDPPSLDDQTFSATDVGAKIPNYTPGAQWGTQAEPFSLMQDPLQAEESINA